MDYQPGHIIGRDMAKTVDTLCTWVNQNTHVTNLPGQQHFAKMLADTLESVADVVTLASLAPMSVIDSHGHLQQQAVGPAVLASKRPEAKIQWYIGGHYDTVFPAYSDFQQASFINKEKLSGPGVLDMKGGLMILLLALQAFETSPFAKDIGWRIVINPDEEIGSLASANFIEQQAKDTSLGFIFEPALDLAGTWAGARGGSAKYTLIVRGKSAHVGRNFHEGRNAIVGCAMWVMRLAMLNQDFPHCAINIGKIQGGEAVNQVPELAMAYLDVRAPSTHDLVAIDEAITTLLKDQDEDLEVSCHKTGSRLPKTMSSTQQQLLHWSQGYLAQHQYQVSWRDTGGCCDGNNLAALGVPNIDTLGGCGAHIHSPEEWLALPSLYERAEMTAWLWHGLAEVGGHV